jgi:GINS complex subunit 1
MSASLLKDIVQSHSSPEHIPFNDDGLRNSVEGLRRLFEEYKVLKAAPDLDENASVKAKLFIVSLQIKRQKRVLLTYQMERALCLSRKMADSSDFYQRCLPNLSKAETKFYHVHADNIIRFKAQFGNELNLFGPIAPPKDYYIQVLVERDCGVIQTEHGQLMLDRGTLHFVKRSDVEHLISKGYLIHLT